MEIASQHDVTVAYRPGLRSCLASPAMARLVSRFLLYPERPLHLRALQRCTRLGMASLTRDLRYLSAMGFVNRRDGENGAPGVRRASFTAAPEAPAWRALRALARVVATPVELLGAALAEVAKVAGAWIYGSEARGDARPESDVDVLVVLDSERASFDDRVAVAGATMEVGALLGREVNATIVTRQELEARLAAAHGFMTRIWQAPRIAILGDDILAGDPSVRATKSGRNRRGTRSAVGSAIR